VYLYKVLAEPLPVFIGLGTAFTLALLSGFAATFVDAIGALFLEGVEVAVCISFSFLFVNIIYLAVEPVSSMPFSNAKVNQYTIRF
jgi:hypothetical protein